MTSPEQAVLQVLADGFNVKQEALEAALRRDRESRRLFHQLVSGNGSSDTVDQLHARFKQQLLYEH